MGRAVTEPGVRVVETEEVSHVLPGSGRACNKDCTVAVIYAYTMYTPMQKVAKPMILPVRIEPELAAKLDSAVSKLHYASRSAFVREAIEQHVKERLEGKMIEVREVSVEEAAAIIDGYLSRNPGAHYVSELAEELGLELGVAFKAAKALEAQGMAKARPQ